MRRRDFLKTVGRGSLGVGGVASGVLPLSVLSGCTVPMPEVGFTGWTWVHGNADTSVDEWRQRFGRIREAGFGGVLVNGAATGPMSEAAHAEGLTYHRWMWILNRNNDARVQEEHPEWFTISRNGESSIEHPPYVGYYKWLCPSREPVRQYLRAEIGAAADDPAVDGVHLDYIRHCDVILPRGLWETYDLVQDHEMAEFDFCYCDECRSQFIAQAGRDPMELEDPASDEEWVRFRWDSVTRLVHELVEEVHARRKPISAAVFPTPTIARTLVRQSWDEWGLDMVFPMLYNGFYLEDVDWIGDRVVEGIRDLAGTPTELRAGVYLPDLDPEALGRAIRVAHAGGALGFSTFELNGLTDAHLEVVRRTMDEIRSGAVG